VTEPRRVLIDWDYGAHGIWWVLTRQEKEAPAPGRTERRSAPDRSRAHPGMSSRLTSELLDDLQEWNDSWDSAAVDAGALQERGRDASREPIRRIVPVQIGGYVCHPAAVPAGWSRCRPAPLATSPARARLNPLRNSTTYSM